MLSSLSLNESSNDKDIAIEAFQCPISMEVRFILKTEVISIKFLLINHPIYFDHFYHICSSIYSATFE
jgi:hypothetical protein